MRIAEIFYSLQGEGFLAGVPSVFIRFAGCPLRCKWCDTKYAWGSEAGAELSVDKIIGEVAKHPIRYVVVTGGEPMVRKDLPELTTQLKAKGYHITVETAGIAYLPHLVCDLMSISPKLKNSVPVGSRAAMLHEKSRLDMTVLGKLIDDFEYQLKFVVESGTDIDEIEDLLAKLSNVDMTKVMVMPQAASKAEYLEKAHMVAEICKQTGFVFCQRLQVLLWNGRRGA